MNEVIELMNKFQKIILCILGLDERKYISSYHDHEPSNCTILGHGAVMSNCKHCGKEICYKSVGRWTNKWTECSHAEIRKAEEKRKEDFLKKYNLTDNRKKKPRVYKLRKNR
jgi:hypothetical protein